MWDCRRVPVVGRRRRCLQPDDVVEVGHGEGDTCPPRASSAHQRVSSRRWNLSTWNRSTTARAVGWCSWTPDSSTPRPTHGRGCYYMQIWRLFSCNGRNQNELGGQYEVAVLSGKGDGNLCWCSCSVAGGGVPPTLHPHRHHRHAGVSTSLSGKAASGTTGSDLRRPGNGGRHLRLGTNRDHLAWTGRRDRGGSLVTATWTWLRRRPDRLFASTENADRRVRLTGRATSTADAPTAAPRW